MKIIEKEVPAVYIMANKARGKVYVGVTTQLWAQVAEHKKGSIAGVARKYKLNNLVWYEHHESMPLARWRQKRLKALHKDWKIFLIEKRNPEWLDQHGLIDPEVKYEGAGPARLKAKASAKLKAKPGARLQRLPAQSRKPVQPNV